MAKVASVKVDEKATIKEAFKRKGIPTLLSEVKFSDSVLDDPQKALKRAVSNIKSKVKSQFEQETREQKMLYPQLVNLGVFPYHVQLGELDEPSLEEKDHLVKLIKLCSDLRGTHTEPDVVRVTLTNGKEVYTGYSLLNGNLKGSFHRTRRGISGAINKFGYSFLLDMTTLLSEVLLVQSLLKFAADYPETVQYAIVRNSLVELPQKYLPASGEYRAKFLEIAERFEMDTSSAKDSSFLHLYEDLFFGRELNTVGNQKEIHDRNLLILIKEFVRLHQYTKQKAKEEYQDRSEYARAFQTKKAIKLSHQQRMENNVFLEKYGYTELDNDVDLEKFKIVEDNFKELMKNLYIPNRRDFSFRIKKLGKHRAAGVFYPSEKTTIFDLKHPDAYVHEYFHQIDYILAYDLPHDDCFSETIQFRNIYDRYAELLKTKVNNLDDSHPFKVQWLSNNKYNAAYFLKPTEVFARAGELYVSHLGLKPNSLYKERDELIASEEYIMDELFIKHVQSFFDTLFQRLQESEHSLKAEPVSSSVTRYEQMSFL